MKLTSLLIVFVLSLIAMPVFAVGTTIKIEPNNPYLTTVTQQIEQVDQKHLLSRATKKLKSVTQWIAKKIDAKGILDSPKKLLIYAAIAFLGGIALTLVGSVFSIGFLSFISWLLLLISFALVVLWVYSIFIRR